MLQSYMPDAHGGTPVLHPLSFFEESFPYQHFQQCYCLQTLVLGASVGCRLVRLDVSSDSSNASPALAQRVSLQSWTVPVIWFTLRNLTTLCSARETRKRLVRPPEQQLQKSLTKMPQKNTIVLVSALLALLWVSARAQMPQLSINLLRAALGQSTAPGASPASPPAPPVPTSAAAAPAIWPAPGNGAVIGSAAGLNCTLFRQLLLQPNATEFVQAIGAAGLTSLLDNMKLEATVFTPRDGAFDLLMQALNMSMQQFFAPSDMAALQAVLLYHIVPGPPQTVDSLVGRRYLARRVHYCCCCLQVPCPR